MADTSIEWATKVWNPLRGCSKVSEGCRNCYAIRQAHRFSGKGMPYHGLTKETPNGANWTGKVMMVPEKLGGPLKWRNPQRVFVNSMSDLFHESVPFDYIDQVIAVMALAPQHNFMILTKRPERMAEYMTSTDRHEIIGHMAMSLYEEFGGRGDCSVPAGLIHGVGKVSNLPVPEHPKAWPLPNVWLGTSVENQQAADQRIHHLNKTPAVVRFLSCEPLLGPLKLDIHLQWKSSSDWKTPLINWVIAGGESGHKARPMHPDWVLSIRDQCQAADVPFFFKQWGEWTVGRRMQEIEIPGIMDGGTDGIIKLTTVDPPCKFGKQCYVSVDGEGRAFELVRIGKYKAGRMLDGREWNEYPEV